MKIEGVALSTEEREATLYLRERHPVFDSLRRPAIYGYIKEINVRTIDLERYLERDSIKYVDFMKIDTEGRELEIRKGARKLVERDSSRVITIEISDVRTEPWGFPS